MIVWEGRKVIAVLPDREKDLGEVRADQFIITSVKTGVRGPVLDVFVVEGDDALAQSIKAEAQT